MDGSSTELLLAVLNRGQGTGLRADGLSYGVEAYGNVGVAAMGDVGIVAVGIGGVRGHGTEGVGVEGQSRDVSGVLGESQGGYGVEGKGHSSDGVHGSTTRGSAGVSGDGPIGVYGSETAHGVAAHSSGAWAAGAALYAENDNPNQGVAAHLKSRSDGWTVRIQNDGAGGVLFLQNPGDLAGAGGSDFITAVGREAEKQFRVASSGQVRSDVGFATPAEDFAELVGAASGLEPGDVLAIGPDGRLVRATSAHQTSVAGVYSESPGFLGGQPVDADPPVRVPLATVGIVPVKASAENGAIRPGDLLVAAGTPGQAMKSGPNPPPGAVLGKAMGSLDSQTGRIPRLAMLR